MIKLLVTIGTRPEAIKMAPLLKRLKESPAFETLVCNTGQHRELLTPVLNFFNLNVDYNLETMAPGQSLHQLTASVISRIEPVLASCKPDMVLVHGDTTTSFATALAAFYSGMKVGHVEAGLRTYQKLAPFPEEINRHLTSVISDMHFAPTVTAAKNLQKEGVTSQVHITGNTVIDALMDGLKLVNETAPEILHLKKLINPDQKLILFTGHRRENFGAGFEEIFDALGSLLETRKNIQVIYPVHPNPLIKSVAEKYSKGSDSIHLIEPLSYGAFIWLMKQAWVIMTDSGGIQEEAPSLGKPVLVLREVTERPEAVEEGSVILVGTNKQKILHTAYRLLDDTAFYQQMSLKKNPYGDGNAAERIIDHIKQYFLVN